jgi:hypothetical protein
MKLDGDVWKKWQKWVGIIESDLANSVDDQAMFDVFREVVEQNGAWIDSNEGATFVDLVKRSFASAAFMVVRRQVKARDKDAVSLLRLLTELAAQSHQLTYDAYLSFHPLEEPDHWAWQRRVFDGLSEDGQVISKPLLDTDIAEANRLSDQIEEIADRQVAHLDPKGTAAKVTFDDLRTCLDYFDKLTVKYIRFFTGTSYAGDTMKARLAFDTRRVFRRPFIKPEDV